MIRQGINLSGKQGAGHQVRGESALGSSHPGVRESFIKGQLVIHVALLQPLKAAIFTAPKLLQTLY